MTNCHRAGYRTVKICELNGQILILVKIVVMIDFNSNLGKMDFCKKFYYSQCTLYALELMIYENIYQLTHCSHNLISSD